jgi:hypothetical protein
MAHMKETSEDMISSLDSGTPGGNPPDLWHQGASSQPHRRIINDELYIDLGEGVFDHNGAIIIRI